jgi:hypothetical protein
MQPAACPEPGVGAQAVAPRRSRRHPQNPDQKLSTMSWV